MEISEISEMELTSEDIRWARHTHLARLTGLDASVFSAWSAQRGISERNLSLLAEKLGTDRSTVLEGLDLRRQDNAIARAVHQKFEELIAQLAAA